jgi:hypothetical protein
LTKSKTKSVLIIYGINILFSITSILYALNQKIEVVACYILLMFGVIWLILKTDIVFERNRGEKKK